MTDLAEQIVRCIDNKEFDKLNNLVYFNNKEIINQLDEKYQIIAFIYFPRKNESFEKFVELGYPWVLLEGMNLIGIHFIKFNESWYCEKMLEGLTNIDIYIVLLKNIAYKRLLLSNEFVNHYLFINDPEGKLLRTLIREGLDFDNNESTNLIYLEIFMRYSEIAELKIIPKIKEEQTVDYRIKLAEIVVDLFHENFEVSELLDRFDQIKNDRKMLIMISKNYDMLCLSDQVRFVNLLSTEISKSQLFNVISKTNNLCFMEVWNNEFIKKNFIEYKYINSMSKEFLKYLSVKLPDLRNDILLNMLKNMYDDVIYYVYPDITHNEIVETIKERIEELEL